MLENRILEIEKDLKDNKLEDHQVWEDANNWAIRALGHANEQKRKVEALWFGSLEEKAFTIPDENAQATFDRISTIQKAVADALEAGRRQLVDSITGYSTTYFSVKESWDKAYGEENSRYIQALRNQGAENLSALNRELATKKQERDTIEKELEPQRQKLKESKDTLVRQRETKLQDLVKCREDLRRCRVSAADLMTKRLTGTVLIIISDKRNLKKYYELLDEYSGKGIQKREGQLQKAVDKFTPLELAQAIRDHNIERLCEAGITENTAEVICKLAKPNLMKLERIHCDDITEIMSISEGKPRLLKVLSVGQMSTAILSIILLDESRPLVIDQPEDELDHEFIMSNVVDTLASVKRKSHPLSKDFEPRNGRQYIISTHNQNIPVLGYAEMVFKMRKVTGEEKCAAESAFGLERSETIKHILKLEGGREAFQRRSMKYGPSVPIGPK